MKEIELPQRPDQAVHATKEQKAKVPQKVGSAPIHRGHRVFVFDETTHHLRQADASDMATTKGKMVAVGEGFKVIQKRDIVVKPNHLYLTTLNRANAIRKLNKMGYSPLEND